MWEGVMENQKLPKLGSAPQNLPADAHSLWREIVKLGQGRVSNLDRTAVEITCRSYAEYRSANDQAVKAELPNLKADWMKVADLARKAVMAGLAELGFTPAARRKLDAGASRAWEPPQDPSERNPGDTVDVPEKKATGLEKFLTR